MFHLCFCYDVISDPEVRFKFLEKTRAATDLPKKITRNFHIPVIYVRVYSEIRK